MSGREVESRNAFQPVGRRIAYGMPRILPALPYLCLVPLLGSLPSPGWAQEQVPVRFSFQPWASVFVTGPDREVQLTPLFLDVRTGDDVDPIVRAELGADLDVEIGPYVNLVVRSHFNTDATNDPLARTYKRKKSDRMSWVPVVFTADGGVEPVDYHGSAHVHALCQAHGLIAVPVGVSEIAEGTVLHVRQI